MFKNFDLIQGISVSVAPNATTSDLGTVGLDEIVKCMQSDSELEQAIVKIRAVNIDPDLTEERKEELEGLTAALKRQLPYFSFGSFQGNYHSTKNFMSIQFTVFDADNINDPADLAALRQKVETDHEILMSFASPTGKGLKFVIRLDRAITDPNEYKDFYIAMKREFNNRYGIKLDDSTKDCTRATFFSYDPEIYVNPGCTPVAVIIPEDPIDTDEIHVETPAAEPKKKKHKTALQGTTVGNRHGDLVSLVGHLITKDVDEDFSLDLMRIWNLRNTPPKEDQEIIDTVKDLYERYSKDKPENFAGQCTDFWSMGTDFLEFGVKGGEFFMSKIGKEKFHGFVGAKEKEAKDAAFLYLLQHKHISNIRLVNHISDVAAAETSYD